MARWQGAGKVKKMYKMSIIDWSRPNGRKVILQQYYKSMREVRRNCPLSLHYSKNGKCFIAHCGPIECLVVKC